MMKALLICPADRQAVAFLAQHRPLALVPILGRPLLDLWLADLATRGARHVTILAADRPDQIRAAVGRGESWGLRLDVLPEKNESTPDQARARHRTGTDWLPEPWDVVVLDRLPSDPSPLWESCAAWFQIQLRQLTPSLPQRIGMRELAPGIAIHLRARVSSSARLDPPCWIGAHAWIGPGVHLGANTIVEEAAYLDEGTEITNSLIAPYTYVGGFTEVRDSLAWGRDLLRWTTGAHTEIVDSFLLDDLTDRIGRPRRSSIFGRAAALLALVLLAPAFLLAWIRRRPGQPLLDRHHAVKAPVRNPDFANTCLHWHLTAFQGLWRRLPELWNVARGDFAWVGNRPLTPTQVASLHNEFERLWLAVPAGLFSLADVEGCSDPFGDEARAHASFYAVQRHWKTDLRILRRILPRLLRGA